MAHLQQSLVSLLTLDLAAWPARNICDRILERVWWRQYDGGKSKAHPHKLSPATSLRVSVPGLGSGTRALMAPLWRNPTISTQSERGWKSSPKASPGEDNNVCLEWHSSFLIFPSIVLDTGQNAKLQLYTVDFEQTEKLMRARPNIKETFTILLHHQSSYKALKLVS